MSREVGRAGTPFQTQEGRGVCCLPGSSPGSGLEFRGLAVGKVYRTLSLGWWKLPSPGKEMGTR